MNKNELIQDLMSFLDASPTAVHASHSMAQKLLGNGATELDETSAWQLTQEKLYFVRRGGGLIAWRMGRAKTDAISFSLAGAHSDSPGLKLRLEKALNSKAVERVAVEVYGGPIISTWLDRPLSVAGTVMLRKENKISTHLYNSQTALGIIPNLAIHLNKDINKGFEYNAQNHLPLLLASTQNEIDVPQLKKIIAKKLHVQVDEIIASDLFLADAQGASLIGEAGEFLSSYRLDDLSACHAILAALIASSATEHTQLAYFMDHEEIGSASNSGANSIFLYTILERIVLGSGGNREDFLRACQGSFNVSVDVAHGYNPGYSEKYDDFYSPVLGKGIAIKTNANLRYATNAQTSARFALICERACVPVQYYMVRADSSPGSTIGPYGNSHTGIPTIDIGAPLLAMHSIRETINCHDHINLHSALKEFFNWG